MAYEIAFGVDTGYVKYAGIVMTSIVAENAGRTTTCIGAWARCVRAEHPAHGCAATA